MLFYDNPIVKYEYCRFINAVIFIDGSHREMFVSMLTEKGGSYKPHKVERHIALLRHAYINIDRSLIFLNVTNWRQFKPITLNNSFVLL